MTTYTVTVQTNPPGFLPSLHERATLAMNHVTAMDRLLGISATRGGINDALSERLNRDIAEIGRLHSSGRSRLACLALENRFQMEDPRWTVERLERLFSLLSSEDISNLDKIRAETEYKIDLLRKEILLDPFYKKPLQKPVRESATSFWPWEEQELIRYIQTSLVFRQPEDGSVPSPYDENQLIEFDLVRTEAGLFEVKLKETNNHPYGQEVLNWFKKFHPHALVENASVAGTSLVSLAPSEDRQTLGFQLFMYERMAKNVQKIRNERIRGWLAENLGQTIRELKEELEKTTRELEEEFKRQVEQGTRGLEQRFAETEAVSNQKIEQLLARQQNVTQKLEEVQQFSDELRKNCMELEQKNRMLEEANRRDRAEIQRLHEEANQGGGRGRCAIL